MKGKTCCVTGHRDLPQNEINKIKTTLAHEIDAAVTDGFTCFMSGFADGVDQYFVELVLERKQTTPALELIAVIPYRKRLDSLNKKTRTRELLEACADVVVIQEKYLPSVYSHRNRYMVEHSDRVIAVYDGRETGGTAKTIRFTHRMKKELRSFPKLKIPHQSHADFCSTDTAGGLDNKKRRYAPRGGVAYRLFLWGFPKGATPPFGTRLCEAKCSVLYALSALP